MATHSSTLAWKISWTEEPGGLQAMGSQWAGRDWALTCYYILIMFPNTFTSFFFFFLENHLHKILYLRFCFWRSWFKTLSPHVLLVLFQIVYVFQIVIFEIIVLPTVWACAFGSPGDAACLYMVKCVGEAQMWFVTWTLMYFPFS